MKKLMIVICSLLLLIGCGCAKKERAAIKIGDIDVTAEEFQSAFKSTMPEAEGDAQRKGFLDTFISRKLILREAERLGLVLRVRGSLCVSLCPGTSHNQGYQAPNWDRGMVQGLGAVSRPRRLRAHLSGDLRIRPEKILGIWIHCTGQA